MNIFQPCLKVISQPQNINSFNLITKRCIGRWVFPTMVTITKRKKKLGKPAPAPRSSFTDWNYEAEIFAFNARLKEKFNLNILTKALTHKSYVFQQEKKQRDVGIEDPKLNIEDNRELIEIGRDLTSRIIKTYLSLTLPRTPKECITAFHDYLMSDTLLAKSASYIGTKDIIFTEEYPPSEETMVNTFLALVAALSQSVNEVHAGIFVRDFLIAALAEADLAEIWNPEDPVQILNDILIKEGKEEVEPRLIAATGVNTLVPVYQIGLYSNKEYISSGTEDNINDAIKIAALNALYSIFDISTASPPIKFNLVTNPSDSMKNLPLHKWSIENIDKLFQRNY